MKLNSLIAIIIFLFVSFGAQASVFAGSMLQLENRGPGGIDYPNSLVEISVPISGSTTFDWGTTWNRPAPIQVTISDTGPNSAIVTLIENYNGGNYASSPNLALFSSLSDEIPLFTNVTLDSSTTPALYDPTRVQFSDKSFSFDYGSLPIISGGRIQLNISTSPVPIPAAMWLVASAFAVFGLFGRGKTSP